MEKGWRRLKVGEVIMPADEAYYKTTIDSTERWMSVSQACHGEKRAKAWPPVRRRIAPRKAKARSWDGWANLDHDNEPTFFSKTPPSKAHTAQYIRVRITEVLNVP